MPSDSTDTQNSSKSLTSFFICKTLRTAPHKRARQSTEKRSARKRNYREREKGGKTFVLRSYTVKSLSIDKSTHIFTIYYTQPAKISPSLSSLPFSVSRFAEKRKGNAISRRNFSQRPQLDCTSRAERNSLRFPRIACRQRRNAVCATGKMPGQSLRQTANTKRRIRRVLSRVDAPFSLSAPPFRRIGRKRGAIWCLFSAYRFRPAAAGERLCLWSELHKPQKERAARPAKERLTPRGATSPPSSCARRRRSGAVRHAWSRRKAPEPARGEPS